MAINPDIRDQAYQFFIEEAPELLQILESGLLNLSQERSVSQVHNLMRAAHSIKGGAASVGLDAIATLAHRLENIFKALYSEALAVDTELENQLLQAYDCLRLPLTEQITTGFFDVEQALAIAEPILTQIEERCGDAITQTESYIPSSSDLGVDMISSILEVDVTQGLEHLAMVVAQPQDYEVAGELRAQVEVFAGFAELLNLPEFGTIAGTVQRALDAHPDRALEITQLALADFEQSKQALLAGDRSSGARPSQALVALAEAALTDAAASDQVTPFEAVETVEIADSLQDLDIDFSQLESIFGNAAMTDIAIDEDSIAVEAIDDSEYYDQNQNIEETAVFSSEVADSSTDVINASILSEADLTQTADFESEIDIEATIEDPLIVDVENPAPSEVSGALQVSRSTDLYYPTSDKPRWNPTQPRQAEAFVSPSLTVRVDSDRLERMNNLVGELMINRDGLSLQSEQLQGVLRELLNRFTRFQSMMGRLRELSDQMIVAPEHHNYEAGNRNRSEVREEISARAAAYRSASPSSALIEFDPLEMDNYGALHSQLQEILEDVVQLEEAVDDITLFNRQSNQILDQQRQTLTHLQNELKWARMLPLGEVINRFPRVLRDLSTTYHKPVNLKLTGTDILVEKAILEKLYDPLLHLLRNAFDHGIESPSIRQKRGKSEQGQIEIRAYHKGNQTIIEVRDDGQGLNLERIRSRAFELGWMSPDQLLVAPPAQLFELIFEPGFSTAYQVSELSGRGVGLDVVRSQLTAIKGTVAVSSLPGKGTTFTLYLPLTLTISKLIICLVGSTAIALPADSVEEILTPGADQTKQSGTQRFLYWQEQIIPSYRLADLLEYACPVLENPPSKALTTISTPKDWAAPALVLRQEQQTFALEVDRLVNEQELVIKPFSSVIAPPPYAYGCTILGDGSLIPVIDATALLSFGMKQSKATALIAGEFEPSATIKPTISSGRKSPVTQTPTILVVDDAITLRRTLALSLERAGFRVLQARDGWEAIDRLKQSASVKLVICDIEMPNMNGFEFLSYRRQDPQLSKIPIVMLTSRSNEKHRWLAKQLGATDYFTKPYLEQEFLAAIQSLLSKSASSRS